MFVKAVSIEKAPETREKMESPEPSHRAKGEAAENLKRYE
jgi:hypothetical protein